MTRRTALALALGTMVVARPSDSGAQGHARVLSVDAQPVRELGIDAARARLSQAPGTRVRIGVSRDGSLREVSLELAEIL